MPRHHPLIFLLAWLLELIAADAAAGNLYSRDLDCGKQPEGRAGEICRAMEDALELTWKGHAIISPGFRMTIERERSVYCSLPLTADDTRILVDMVIASDSRGSPAEAQLNNGARSLLALLGQKALERFPEPGELPNNKMKRQIARHLKEEIALLIADPVNIYNPAHPKYILGGGCR